MSEKTKADREAPTKARAICKQEEASSLANECTTTNAIRARNRAELWVRDNPTAWAFLVKRFDWWLSREEKFSSTLVFEEIRRRDFTGADGRKTPMNNDLRAALMRLYLEIRPQARQYADIRKSTCDKAFERV